MGVSPVTRPGNQAGQGRPGPDIHGGRCRKTSSLPVAFLPKSFEPQTGPKFYQQAPCVFQPLVFQANPSSTSPSPSLPNCLSKAPYLLSFTISYSHDFGTSLPYKSFKTSPKEAKNPSSTSAGSSWRRRLTAQPNVFQQRGNVKQNLKKIQSPKEKNTCVLKRGNPRSLSEEESPKWRLSGATSGTLVFH